MNNANKSILGSEKRVVFSVMHPRGRQPGFAHGHLQRSVARAFTVLYIFPGCVYVGTLFPACLVLSPCVVAPPPRCARFCPGALACG